MADMDAKLEAALDLFGSATTATLVTYQRAGKTLAAAVRAECRRADSNLTWVHQQQDRARKAESALAEVRGRVEEAVRWAFIFGINSVDRQGVSDTTPDEAVAEWASQDDGRCLDEVNTPGVFNRGTP